MGIHSFITVPLIELPASTLDRYFREQVDRLDGGNAGGVALLLLFNTGHVKIQEHSCIGTGIEFRKAVLPKSKENEVKNLLFLLNCFLFPD